MTTGEFPGNIYIFTRVKRRIYKNTFKDGFGHGEYESYWPNGKLYRRGSNKNGKREGSWETYLENGQLLKKGNYKDRLKGK